MVPTRVQQYFIALARDYEPICPAFWAALLHPSAKLNRVFISQRSAVHRRTLAAGSARADATAEGNCEREDRIPAPAKKRYHVLLVTSLLLQPQQSRRIRAAARVCQQPRPFSQACSVDTCSIEASVQRPVEAEAIMCKVRHCT